jgi:hypothetical protein
MSNPSISPGQPLSRSTPSPRRLAVAAAAVLLTAAVAAPASHAMIGASGASGAGGASFTAYSGPASGGAAAPNPALRAIPFHAVVDAAAPAAGQAMPISKPRDASTGLFIGGPVSAQASGGDVDFKAAAIIDERTSGTTAPLTLDLVATTTVPQDGVSFSGVVLASISLGTLNAGTELTNVNSGELAMTNPSAGCYYLSLVLVESGDAVDIRTLPAGGTPEDTGYSEFGFGQTCPAATTCTRTTNSVCLDSSRFQVTVVYDNTTTGAGAGQVLLFGSTRAESDESGFFYFTDASNFEMGAKVLDACSFNNAFWVFIGGLTNQGWTLNVLDTQTGNTKSYGNTDGTTTVTTTDTTALPCP